MSSAPRNPRPDSADAVESLVEEIVLRRLRGENVKVDAILGEHANAHLQAEVRARVRDALRQSNTSSRFARPTVPALREFAVLMEIDRDETGVTYLANQVSLGRTVALKVLPESVSEDPARVRRFLGLSRKLESIRHTAIAPVLAYGDESGILYTATDRIPGISLEDALGKLHAIAPQNRTARDLAEALGGEQTPAAPSIREKTYALAIARAFAELAEGLAHAHGKGVFHGDIRPSHILLDERARPRLLNFGLSSVLETPGMKRSAQIFERSSYASPEVISDGAARVTARSDIFSLGCCLFEALTGFPPHRASTVPELLAAIQDGAADVRQALRGKAPSDLVFICCKAMEAAPERRYATMDAFARDLRAFVDSRPIAAAPAGLFRGLYMIARRNQWTSAAIGIPLLAAITFTFGFFTNAFIERVQTKRAVKGAIEAADTRDLNAAQRFADVLREFGQSFSERERIRIESHILLLRANIAVELAREEQEALTICVEDLETLRARLRAVARKRRASFLPVERQGEIDAMTVREADLAQSFAASCAEIEAALDDAERYSFKAGVDSYEPVRAGRAALAYARYVEALSRHDRVEARRLRNQVELYDDSGEWKALLEGYGRLSVRIAEQDTAYLFRYAMADTVSPNAGSSRLVPVPSSGAPLGEPTPLTSTYHVGDPCLRVLRATTIGSDGSTRLLADDLIVHLETAGTGDGTRRESLRQAQRRLLEWIELLADENAAAPMRLTILRDGEAVDLSVDSGAPLAVQTEATAYPLIYSPEAKLAPRLDARDVAPGSYLLVVRSSGRTARRLPFEMSRNGLVEIDVSSQFPGGESPADAVWIHPGVSKQTSATEQPATARKPGFWMAVREVTRAEWARVLGNDSADLNAEVPITAVTWNQVEAFLAELNRQLEESGATYRADLPTGSEWYLAATGLQARTAPWGDADDSLGNRRLRTSEPRFPAAIPIADESPYGVRGMGGGPAEWVRDRDPAQPDLRFFRGGRLRSDVPTPLHLDQSGAATPREAPTGVGIRLVYRPL